MSSQATGRGPIAAAPFAVASEASGEVGSAQRYQQNMLLPYPQFGFCHIV